MQGLAGRRRLEWENVVQFRILSRCFYIFIVLFYGVWFRTKERGINLIGSLEGMILRHLIKRETLRHFQQSSFAKRFVRGVSVVYRRNLFHFKTAYPLVLRQVAIYLCIKLFTFCHAVVRFRRWVRKVLGNEDGTYMTYPKIHPVPQHMIWGL
jgi:hypothetical protein